MNGKTFRVEAYDLERGITLDNGIIIPKPWFEWLNLAAGERFPRWVTPFGLAYVITTHKAQGSEWPNVLVLDEFTGADRARWLYVDHPRGRRRPHRSGIDRMPQRPSIHCPAFARSPQQCRQLHDRDRGNSAERGYDRRWRNVRAAFLKAYPLCADCEQVGRLTEAVEVHHMRRVAEHPELRLVWDNLRSLCRDCHAVDTGRERAGVTSRVPPRGCANEIESEC